MEHLKGPQMKREIKNRLSNAQENMNLEEQSETDDENFSPTRREMQNSEAHKRPSE